MHTLFFFLGKKNHHFPLISKYHRTYLRTENFEQSFANAVRLNARILKFRFSENPRLSYRRRSSPTPDTSSPFPSRRDQRVFWLFLLLFCFFLFFFFFCFVFSCCDVFERDVCPSFWRVVFRVICVFALVPFALAPFALFPFFFAVLAFFCVFPSFSYVRRIAKVDLDKVPSPHHPCHFLTRAVRGSRDCTNSIL